MKDRLVTIFEQNPHDTFATSELVERTHPERYQDLRTTLNNADGPQRRKASREKAKLHRKLLHHLRGLEDQDVISTVRRTTTGEKVYTYQAHDTPTPQDHADLTIRQDDQTRSEAIQDAIDSDQAFFSHDVQADPSVDAVLIDAANHAPKELHDTITKITSVTNDCIAITGVTDIIETYNEAVINDFLDKLTAEMNKTGCYACLRLNFNDAQRPKDLNAFITAFYERTSSNVKLVAAAAYKENMHETYETLLSEAQRTQRKAHLEFTNVTPQPVFVGQHGPYTIPLHVWERLNEQVNASLACLAHTTFTIDINAYMDDHSLTDLRQLITDAAQHLYVSTAEARNDITVALKNYFNKANEFFIDFFSTTQNYIRCWNYSTEDTSFESFKTLIDNVADQTETLTQKQATIFQACGIPLHVNAMLAPSFSTATPNQFTQRQYTKKTLYNLNEFNQDYWQQFLDHREETARMFDYADRTRVFRAPATHAASPVAEIKHLHKHRALPLLCYDFQRLQRERQLHEFL